MINSFVLPFKNLADNDGTYLPGFMYLPTLCFAEPDNQGLILHFFCPETPAVVVPQVVRLTTFCDPVLILRHRVQHMLPVYSYKDYELAIPLHTDEQHAQLLKNNPHRGREYRMQRFEHSTVMGFAYIS